MELNRRQFVAASGVAALSMAVCGNVAQADEAPGVGTLYTKYRNPDEIGIIHEAAKEEDFDVVVVGTGIGGICCSMLLAEQAPEAKVLLIDKMPVPGGNTNFAEICQPAYSKTWEQALSDALERASKQNNMIDPFLWATVHEDDGRLSEWFFVKHQVELSDDRFFYKGHVGAGMVTMMTGKIQSDPTYASIDMRLNTQAIALLTSDPYTVTGVQIKDRESGEYINVNAKAVMLATGGMGTNPELLRFYNNADVLEKAEPIGLGQDGDGQLMVEYTAHDMAKLSYFGSGWVVVKGKSIMSPLSCAACMQTTNVFVNQYGKRFNNESANSGPTRNSNFMVQGKVYSIMGKGIIDYFEANGSTAGMFYFWHEPTAIQDELAESIDDEFIFKADSFEELAEKIGVPVETFVAEMEQYEADALAGTGDSVFGKPAELTLPFGEPPYYAMRCAALLVQSNGGIRVNTDCQVCDPYFVPIKGLYAGGINVSGFWGELGATGISQKAGLWGGLKAARVIIEKDLGGTVDENWFGDEIYSGELADMSKLELNKPLV
ncbi:MAG: FAD-binding protein [Coriobacteriales bacterium]|nr:FAD-binding protein [Coriobacteriales bacterium]